jgi:aspartate/methionine/tyrosine aminotransferase
MIDAEIYSYSRRKRDIQDDILKNHDHKRLKHNSISNREEKKNGNKKCPTTTPVYTPSILLEGSKISSRALEVQKNEFFLSKGMAIVRNNKYHPITNPNGIINLGTAENKLNNDEILSKLNDPSISSFTGEQLLYGQYCGSDRLRQEVANLLNRHFHPIIPFGKDNLCIGNGCGSLLNLYGNVLFDEGDALLVPGPYYGGFEADIKYESRVYTIPVPHTEDDCLKVTEEALETALKNAKRPVKGIIFANPNNPFGRSYSAEQLLLFCNFAKAHNLIVVCDEIYGLSTWNDIVANNLEKGKTIEDYHCQCDECKKILKEKVPRIKTKIDGENSKFTSIFSLDLPDPKNTHGLWGFSKDFCLNGLRIGVTISYSKEVNDSIQKYSLFTCISTNTDNILCNLLSDKAWVENFIINNNRKLLKNYTHLTNSLRKHNTPYIEGDSGFFIYIDLHQAGLSENDLWMKLLEGGIYSSPSQAFFSEDTEEERNWFRICFAIGKKELDLSLKRLYKVLEDIKKSKK